MRLQTYECCQHCVDPCPANGHKKPCEQCEKRARGARQAVRARVHPPTAVRQRTVPGRRSDAW